MKSWMQGHRHDLKCDSCGLHIESVHHVLRICPIARAVWKREFKILYLVYGKERYTHMGFSEMAKAC